MLLVLFNMPNFLNLINEYAQVEVASKYDYFDDTKSAIYMWYYPIKFKKKVPNINEACAIFYQKGFDEYNNATKLVIEDNRRKIKSEISAFKPKRIDQVVLINHNRSNVISDLIYSLSTFSSPIYIGKSTRDSSVKKRIKEHLDFRTDFSISLNNKLLSTDLSMNDMLIRVIDVQKFSNDYLQDVLDASFDLSQFIEKILINLYKPVYNIKN